MKVLHKTKEAYAVNRGTAETAARLILTAQNLNKKVKFTLEKQGSDVYLILDPSSLGNPGEVEKVVVQVLGFVE